MRDNRASLEKKAVSIMAERARTDSDALEGFLFDWIDRWDDDFLSAWIESQED